MADGIRNIENRLTQEESPNILLKELNVQEVLGNGTKKPNPSEIEIAKMARKSIIAATDIREGTTIKENMLAIKRPGNGILPKYLDRIIGKTAKKDIKKDHLITWENI